MPTTTDDVSGEKNDPAGAKALTEAEIDDVLANPAMTIEEKRAWLATYSGQMADRRDIDRGGKFEPLEMRIRDALSLLADGGHAYGTADRRDTAIASDKDEQRAGGDRLGEV